MRRPGVDPVAPLPADAGDVVLVQDLEDHPEPGLELVLPLQEHRRRAGDDDVLGLLAEQQLAGDEPRLDRLAEPDVVGDEEVHAGQPQRLAQGLELIGVDADAGAEGRLEEAGVGRGDAVPLERVQVGREEPRRVEPPRGDRLPGLGGDDLRVDLLLPEHLERLALGVVVEARQAHERRVVPGARGDDLLDEVLPLTDADDLTRLGRLEGM